jgi:hypothetical protein
MLKVDTMDMQLKTIIMVDAQKKMARGLHRAAAT